MKKISLNLLGSRKERVSYYKYVQIFKYFLLGFTCLLALFVLVAGVMSVNQNNTRTDLQKKKNELIAALAIKREDEGKLIYLSNKLSFYKDFQKDNVQFLPYFNLLKDTLKTASQSGQLEKFDVNKDRVVKFTLEFSDMNEMLGSFGFIESGAFLDKFEKLSLESFSRTPNKFSKEDSTSYKLSFDGKFINLNKQ